MNEQAELFGLEAGRSLRDVALDLVEHTTTEREDWVADARRYAIWYSGAYGQVTSDDVRIARPIPDGVDPRILGAVFRPSKLWLKVGYQPTTMVQAHGRPIAVWRWLGP